MSRKPTLFTVLVLAGAALGLFFAAFSTADFARHLDRQEHSVSCSFTPGLSKAETGKSDCRTTMLSEYSSVMRDSVWGGVPISLPAMSVFAFLLLFALELCLTRRQEDVRATGFLALATALPLVTSLAMAFISLSKLDAACKLCIGIYMSSGLVFTGGLLLWRRAVRLSREGVYPAATPAARPAQAAAAAHAQGADPAWASASPAPADGGPEVQRIPPRPPGTLAGGGGAGSLRPLPVTWGYLVAAFTLGVALVAVPVVAYGKMAPDHSTFIGTCGDLVEDKDPYSVMVPLDHHGGVPAIEVFDPLCPACRAFEKRLASSGKDAELHRVALMFPLDSECNWMVTDRTHPGACAVSEAVLCANDRAPEVVAWAFAEQDRLKTASAQNGDGARALAKARFPELAQCIGSAAAKARLNKSLRWAVRNQLSVYTPQLYIDGVKLCDEDTDLGLEYQLGRMLERSKAGTLAMGRQGRLQNNPAATAAPPPMPEPAPTAAAKPTPTPTPTPTPDPSPSPSTTADPSPSPSTTTPPSPSTEEPKPEEPKPEEPKPAEEKPAEEPKPAEPAPADEGGTP